MTATIQQISNEDYHADTSVIGSSGLKLIAKSPRHFWCKYLDPDREREEPTDAMQFGSLVHTLVLEPHKFEDEFVTMPQGIDRRTKAGNELWNEWVADNQGKVVLSEETITQGKKVAAAILAHPAASLILKRIGAPEHTIYWEETVGIDGGRTAVTVRCKARLDWCVLPSAAFPAGVIIDLKTTKDAGPDFARSAYNLGYHIQAAWYARAMQMAYGTNGTPFAFLAAEKEIPFGVMAYKASDDFMSAGWERCQSLLETYATCITNDAWPCYPETIQDLNLPRWAKENYV